MRNVKRSIGTRRIKAQRHGVSTAQTAVVLLLLAVGVIIAVRALGTAASGDLATTATGVGNPAALVGNFSGSSGGSGTASSGSSGSGSGSYGDTGGSSGSSGSSGSGSSGSGSSGSGDSGSDSGDGSDSGLCP